MGELTLAQIAGVLVSRSTIYRALRGTVDNVGGGTRP